MPPTQRTPPQPVPERQLLEISIADESFPYIEIRATGDILLDVHFQNTSSCKRSIPTDALRTLRSSGKPFPSPRILYRVRLETLQKNSQYFKHLLGPNFAEGKAIRDQFAKITAAGREPSETEPNELPIVKIVDEDTATLTFGRENVFEDMLRILHGADARMQYMSNSLTVLAVMGDRYNVLPPISRFVQKKYGGYRYPIPSPDTIEGEEILRQIILIFYHTGQTIRFGAATKELIMRGSVMWNGDGESNTDLQRPGTQTAWWDLPGGLEVELAHRRACILRTIASVPAQFLGLYSSQTRQCPLGYDSSASCDSYQLGEMIKFLTRKELLYLVPFQAVSPEDDDYIWPRAYAGEIDVLIGILRQCPSYQIDSNHTRCGLRTKLLPAVDYIKGAIDAGAGVRLVPSKSGEGNEIDSWIPKEINDKKAFVVGGRDVTRADNTWEFMKMRGPEKLAAKGSLGEFKRAKELFASTLWDWLLEKPSGSAVGWTRPTLKPTS